MRMRLSALFAWAGTRMCRLSERMVRPKTPVRPAMAAARQVPDCERSFPPQGEDCHSCGDLIDCSNPEIGPILGPGNCWYKEGLS